jgi:hypothetical protein
MAFSYETKPLISLAQIEVEILLFRLFEFACKASI